MLLPLAPLLLAFPLLPMRGPATAAPRALVRMDGLEAGREIDLRAAELNDDDDMKVEVTAPMKLNCQVDCQVGKII